MRKIILMAVAGYLWKKFKANRAAAPVSSSTVRPFSTARASGTPRPADFS